MRIMLFDATRQWTGGAYRVLLFSRELRLRGHEVTVGCLPGSELSKRLGQEGVPFFTLDPRSDINLSVAPEIVRMMRQKAVEVIDVHSPKFYWLALIAARVVGLPVIITRNVPFRKTGIKKKINSLLYGRLVDRVVSVSEKVKRELMVDYEIEDSRIEVIHDGLDMARFEGDGHGKRENSGSFMIGVISRLDYGKGLECFIEAIPEILRTFPDARFLIAGTGAIEESLRLRAHELRIDARITFAGFRNDVPELLKDIDITILPSPDEAMSMIALESMASGVPVVATSGTGLVDIISNMENGVIVKPNDPKALADGVVSLLMSDYRAIGQKAKEVVREKFTTNRVIEQYESLLTSLVRKKR
jgi:glycosyltransferase involved in cell wall biosynthesis